MADEFNHEDVNSQNTNGTGNGSYDYSTDQGSTYQSSYSSGFNTNGTSGNGSGSYNSSYSGGSYNGTGSGDHGGKKKGNGGKIALAIILAAAVGVAGGVGVSTAVRSGSSSAATAETEEETEDNKSVASADESSSDSSSESGSAETESTDSADAASTDESSDSSAKLNTTKSSAVVTDVTNVVEEVMPSVVSVYNNFTQTGETFWGQSYSQEATATGTGFIISEDTDNNELLIATNNHVVENADSLEVQFIDESTASANIKGTDSSNDLAVIAVSLDDIDKDTLSQIKVATLGDSDTLKIGEPVVAIGNALGYGQSVTTGVVSALNREIQSQDSETGDQISGTFIQTDAAINPGNSGGPLVDLNGNVIGIDSSKIGGETVEGMGYAIPISRAVPIIEDLMNQKTKTEVAEADRGYLGISGISVTSQVASAYNMPQGVYVANIIDGGGAADSDLQKGDIITAIEGTTVDDMQSLQKQLTYYAAGDKVTLTVERNNGKGDYEETSVDVTLGDKSAIQDYEDQQNQNENGHTYGYNNGGSDSGNSRSGSGNGSSDNSGSDSSDGSDSNGNGSDNSGDSQDNGSDDYYSFPFSDFFGQY